MDNHLPQRPSFRDTRYANASVNRYITLLLSKHTLENPSPIHCILCGFIIFEANALPDRIIEAKYEPSDLKERSIDVRCKKCKVTYRIT